MAKSKPTHFILEDPAGELNDRQKLFCSNYLTEKFNGTQAAIKAGYSKATADQQASRLLTNVKIIEYIDLLKKDLGMRIGISREMVAAELRKLAFFDARKMLNPNGGLKEINQLDDDTVAAIAGLEVHEDFFGKGKTKKIKVSDKRAAIETLNRMLGYNEPEKTEISGTLGLQHTNVDFK